MWATGNSTQERTTAPTAVRLSIHPGWIALILTGLPFLILSDVPLVYQFIPLIASTIVLGMPHGAVDHLLLARQRDERLTPKWMVSIGVVYLIFGLAYAAVWFVVPVAAFVFFILLTWFHWGQGELYPLIELVGADYVRNRTQQILTILTRGGAPMLVPLVAFPEQYEFVATSLVGLFDAGAAATLSPMFESTSRLIVATAYGALVTCTVFFGYRQTESKTPWLVDAGELLLLTSFFLLVPPILAIGVYFCFWHSLRHVMRTILLHDESMQAIQSGDSRPAIGQFARDATPLTIVALSFIFILYLLVPRTPAELSELIALYLVLIAVLTLPHVVIVTVLDREQGIC